MPPLPKASAPKVPPPAPLPPPEPREPRNLDADIREVLQRLLDGPKLARDLPKYSGVLAELDVRGLAFSRCIERRSEGASSRWLWSISDLGRRWLESAVR